MQHSLKFVFLAIMYGSDQNYNQEETVAAKNLISFTTSIRGKAMLKFNEYSFTLNRKRDSTYYWECVRKRSRGIKCGARIVTRNGVARSFRSTHNH